MRSYHRLAVPFSVLAGLLAACSGSDSPTTPTIPTLSCSPGPAPTVMNAGEWRIIDPLTTGGCLRLPAAGAGGAEYLLAAVSTASQEVPIGVSIDYTLQGLGAPAAGVSSSSPLASPALSAFQPQPTAAEFHAMLRARERALAGEAGAHVLLGAPPVLRAPPVVGAKDTFSVCATTSCTSYTSVIATAKYVGPRGAIYLDDVVPAGGFIQEDIDTLGLLFDGGVAGTAPNMYEIDTTAFGRESDVDGNGKVIFLLTDAVNALSGTCPNGSIILGFFYGGDLLPRSTSNPGSNYGEIFYGLVPKEGGSCSASKDFVKQNIAPVFIHEFQHMISFNQHVLVHGGLESENVWLNEGLSHFAEELGGRELGDGPGQGGSSSRLVQFAINDIVNANEYLLDPESQYLITPGNSTGTIEERGANWLFVRWIADHYATDSLGTSLTRQLVETAMLGGANVQAATGRPMSELIPLWQLANYLDNLPGFTPVDPRLEYPSWDFRHIYDTLNFQRPDLFPRPYPLRPDSTTTGLYRRNGTLRAGSGRHLRIIQAAGSSELDVGLARRDGSDFPADRGVRLGVARIR
jgi:hypothetical protein